MAEINSSVYTDGIKNSFVPDDGKFAVVLLDASNNIVAESAVLLTEPTSATSNQDYYIQNKITWNETTKIITIDSLDYTQTRSTVTGGNTTATQFAVYKVNEVTASPAEAYSNSGKEYFWVYKNGDESSYGDMLFKANLTSSITIGANNNFKFDSVTISFSEAEAQ